MRASRSINGTRESIATTGDFLYNDILVGDVDGACVSVCPPDAIPSGIVELPGTRAKGHAQYGNYKHGASGSICVYVAAFVYKIGTGANGLAVNVVDIKPFTDYGTRAAATAAGYAVHRDFIDEDMIQQGIFYDKYKCSKVAYGAGFVAASILNGAPISTASAHNPIAGLTACATNNYYQIVDACRARDGVDGAVNASSIFFPCTIFGYSALAMLSMAHGQAATFTTYCSWYDPAGITNFPKGNNDNSLGDTNDATVDFTTDGYGTADSSLTGSGDPFAKTTHNGQECGIADLNGNMWEIALGLTRPGTSATDTTNQNDTTAFYVLKESVSRLDLTGGWNTGSDAWGDAAHLATLYDAIDISYVANSGVTSRFGNGANQVLSEATTGDPYKLAGMGFPKDTNGKSVSGTNLFGQDYFYEYHRANLAVIVCGLWNTGSLAGPWARYLANYRSLSNNYVGFRAACFPVGGAVATT